MAKVKVSDSDDNIDLILHQTAKMEKIARDVAEKMALFKQEMDDFKDKSKQSYISMVNQSNDRYRAYLVKTDELLMKRLGQLNKVQEATKSASTDAILQLEGAIHRVDHGIRQKVTWAKAGIWIASMAALFLVGFVAFIEMERRIDLKTVQEAKQQTQQANALIHGIQQWAKGNPNDSRSFWNWANKHGLTGKK